jgi:hypothetical protein
MKTIDYELQSFRGVSARIPEEAMNKAEDLMKMITWSENYADLCGRMEKNPYFSGDIELITDGLYSKSNYLRKSRVDSPRALVFKDEIYLKMGIHDLAKGKIDSIEKIEMIQRIFDVLGELEIKLRQR